MVVAIGGSGRLTVRCLDENFLPEGRRVRDVAGTVEGRVGRVFGPVARPYLSVRLARGLDPGEALELVGRRLVSSEGPNDGPR